MTEWTPQQVNWLTRTQVIRVAGRRESGGLFDFLTIGVVVVAGSPFVRSLHGPNGRWFRRVTTTGTGAIEIDGSVEEVTFVSDTTRIEAVSAAYRSKYGDDSNVQAITGAVAASTTLRLDRV